MMFLDKKRRIMITGGAGFIGSHLVNSLVSQGHSVLNVDALTYAGNYENIENLDPARHIFRRIDIRRYDELLSCVVDYQPEAIIHLAAESHVDRSIRNADDFVTTNINGTFNLLQAARNYLGECRRKFEDFRFIHVSTDEVFGSLDRYGTFNENSPYKPNSPYSASKASSDHLVRSWGETYGLHVNITNCSNNFGSHQFPEKFIPKSIISILKKEKIQIYGSGQNIRDWLHVSDHVSGINAVLNCGISGETYCIGSRNEKSNIEIVNLILAHLSTILNRRLTFDDNVRFIKDRPGHDLRYSIEPEKIEQKLGWRTKSSFHKDLKATIEWYAENENWWEKTLHKLR